MTLQDKIAHSKHLIYEWGAGPAVLLCSFGKDSTVLLDLIRETLPTRASGSVEPTARRELNCHTYPIPVIYFRHPYFPAKHEFANEMIRKWALEIYDFPPLACGVKAKADRLELVTRYQVGSDGIDLPMNTEPPIARRPFVCGLQWLLRPKTLGGQWPWKTVFIGHKSSDVDPYEGPLPLKEDRVAVERAGVDAVFPLRHWTDEDVWTYIETNRVPYDKRRYFKRGEVWDKWLNPDYVHACTACIDPRETRKTVPCPKLNGALVRNLGPTVVRMEKLPDYIQRSEVTNQRSEVRGQRSEEEETQNAIHS